MQRQPSALTSHGTELSPGRIHGDQVEFGMLHDYPQRENAWPQASAALDVTLVDVTPAPVFARLERLHYRVSDGHCVPPSVAHRG
jgi:hypothetical protein